MGSLDYQSSPDLARTIRDMQQQIDALKRAQSGGAAGRLYAEALAEVSTTSSTPVSLTGGPTIAVDVPSGAFVAVFLQCDLHVTTSDPNFFATVTLYEATDIPSTIDVLGTQSASYVTLGSTPGSLTGRSVPGVTGRIEFPASAGARSYSIKYEASGTGTAFFRNRKMYVQVI